MNSNEGERRCPPRHLAPTTPLAFRAGSTSSRPTSMRQRRSTAKCSAGRSRIDCHQMHQAATSSATIDGLTVATLGTPTEGGGPGWHTYVAVDDAEACFRRAGDAAATMFGAPEIAGPAGTSAVIADPSGAEIRLWQQGRTRGTELVNTHGSWNWSNLHTPDPAGVEAFYRDIFGWELRDRRCRRSGVHTDVDEAGVRRVPRVHRQPHRLRGSGQGRRASRVHRTRSAG